MEAKTYAKTMPLTVHLDQRGMFSFLFMGIVAVVGALPM
jgi:hypothetical protein